MILLITIFLPLSEDTKRSAVSYTVGLSLIRQPLSRTLLTLYFVSVFEMFCAMRVLSNLGKDFKMQANTGTLIQMLSQNTEWLLYILKFN